jgi:peptidyl-prolyl cis-trans isomerase C
MSANLRRTVSGLARQPLVHFLVIGAVIGLLHGWLYDRDADRTNMTIRITAADLARTEAEWQARWNRPPTPGELEGLITSRVREAALYREAVAMGLNQNDPIIRRVLVQKLERIARDLVEFSLSPTDQDLQGYFAENTERYRPSPLITFTHVFVDPDRREDRTLPDAAKILAELQSLGEPGEGIQEYGDPFMLQLYYPEKEEQRIGSLFGREFARSVFELATGEWHGPVLSGYGTHLVYVHGIHEFPDPVFSEVREQVTQDWIDENRKTITDQYFAGLLARYDVVIERDSTDVVAEVAAQTP